MGKLIVAALTLIILSCNDNTGTSVSTVKEDTTTINKPSYKSIRYIDSFIAVHNSDITKSGALRQEYEEQCTKQILPLIKSNGLYSDLPFEFVTSAKHNGTIYGNFVFRDDTHFVKVQCTIKPEQLTSLQEGKKYKIAFKTYQLEEGVSFDNTSTDLPTINAALISASPIP